LHLIRELSQPAGVDIYELAERHGTSVRTIRRDLDALQEAYLPLEEDGPLGGRKRWRISSGDRLQKFAGLVDASHYLALRAAMSTGVGVKGSILRGPLDALCDQIKNALGDQARRQLETIEGVLFSSEKFAYRHSPPEILFPLLQAIIEKRICAVRYRSPGVKAKVKQFRILPLRLFSHDASLYLHAFVPRYGDIVLLNLQRLSELKITRDTQEPPANYDPKRWAESVFEIFSGGAPTQYHLRFVPWASDYIRERTWHPTQVMTELADGGLELTFSCAESYEVSRWVASWRDAVEVLSPPSFCEELAELGQWLTARYGG